MNVPLDKAGEKLLELLTEARSASVKAKWREIARPEQIRPDGCKHFAISGGRGSGKTRAGAEDFLERVRSGEIRRAHMVAPTLEDVRLVMVEGLSGIKACALPGEIANWNRNACELEFSNGVVAKGYSGEAPDRLNGPQCNHLWNDEYGLTALEAIDMALLGLRIAPVSSCWTSTPKMTKSTKEVHKTIEDMGGIRRRMRMADNLANLDEDTVAKYQKKWGGTRLGRAELDGEEIEEVEGALWERPWIERDGFRLDPCFIKENGRVVFRPPNDIQKVVVALDPTVSDPEKKKNPHKEMDACGVIVAGVDSIGRGYVLGDYTEVLSPANWAQLAIKLYNLTKAASIVAESNQGGELISEVLKGYGNARVELVTASIGKRPRAEPVAMLYEQGRVFHCGRMDALEDQQCTWDALDPSQRSPNNIDALVWAFHGLGLCDATGGRVIKTLNTRRKDDEDF